MGYGKTLGEANKPNIEYYFKENKVGNLIIEG